MQKIETICMLEIITNNIQHTQPRRFLMSKKTKTTTTTVANANAVTPIDTDTNAGAKSFLEHQLLSIYFFLFGITSIFIDIFNTQQTIYQTGVFMLFGMFDIICATEAYEHLENGFAELDFYRNSPSYRNITIIKRTFLLHAMFNYFSLEGSTSMTDKIFLLFYLPEMCVMLLELGFLLYNAVLAKT